MKTVVHLSDLHFGQVHEALLEPLIRKINSLQPNIIAISGDLTMRASTQEFLKAQNFLGRLPFPKIIVPGNHDIPFFNLYSRFFKALKKYKFYISENLEPVYSNDECILYGLNTARSFSLRRGRIDLEYVEKICQEVARLPPHIIKIIVTHHPIDLPDTFQSSQIARRHTKAMNMFTQAKVDIFLAGHTHTSFIAHVPEQAKAIGYYPLIIQAGTSTSIRTRGEKNSFNVLKLNYPYLKIENYVWNPDLEDFKILSEQHFMHSKNGWIL